MPDERALAIAAGGGSIDRIGQAGEFMIAAPAWLAIPTVSTWASIAVAPFVGSLLGVLIRRLPAHRPVARARSACESCSHVLGAADLVPIASYVVLRGRCRQCGAPIGRFHLHVELAAILVPACLLLLGASDPAALWPGCVLGWTLLALGWIDATHFLLPDVLTLPLLLAGIGVCGLQDPPALPDHAAAAAAAYGGLRLVNWSYRRLRGRDGLGAGDAKLYAAGGAWTGLATLPDILLLAAALGLLMAGMQAVRGGNLTRTTRLPFGAPLALAIWIVWLAA